MQRNSECIIYVGRPCTQVNGLIDAAASTENTEARHSLYQQCAGLLAADPAWLTLYHHIKISGARSSGKGGKPAAAEVGRQAAVVLQAAISAEGILDARARLV